MDLFLGRTSFTFNSGTSEGWTYQLVNYTTLDEIRSGAAAWADNANFPTNPIRADPLGDDRGSAQVPVLASDYVLPDEGSFVLLDLISPDLASLPAWQASRSFSAELAPNYSVEPIPPGGDLPPNSYATLFIIVDDLDEGITKLLVSGDATAITPNEWSRYEFDFASAFASEEPPISDYVIRYLGVRFFVEVESGRSVVDSLFFLADAIRGCDELDITLCSRIFSSEALFRALLGPLTAYGYEIHGLSGLVGDLPPSPIPAGDFANNFAIAFSNLDALNVLENPDNPCNEDGVRSLFTHSVGSAEEYTVTFSDFGGTGQAVTAFGLTVCDFASNINLPAEIRYDTGTKSGTLLFVPGGQPDLTKNFVGIIVEPGDAFTSITLTLNDNLSGFQNFDEVLYRTVASPPTAVPASGAIGLLLTALALGAAGMATAGSRRR